MIYLSTTASHPVAGCCREVALYIHTYRKPAAAENKTLSTLLVADILNFNLCISHNTLNHTVMQICTYTTECLYIYMYMQIGI